MSKIAKYWAKSWLCALVVCWVLPVQAAVDLYRAEVPVKNQSSEAREDALQDALGEVIVRISGDADVALTSAGRSVTARARQLVRQFGYKRVALEQDEAAANTSKPAEPEQKDDQVRPEREEEAATKLVLQVQFNVGAVNNALRGAGLPVWGAERPKTIVWLAQTQGGAPALVRGEQAKPLIETAQARGVPLAFPSQDSTERQRANAADVVAGYNDRLLAASRGYGASHLLVGRLKNSGGLWQGGYALMQGESTLDSWEDSASSQAQLLSDVMQRVANSFARSYAVSASDAANTLVLAVDGLNSARSFARVSNYLADLTAVKTVVPAFINQDFAVFKIELSGDAKVLGRSIALADVLAVDEASSALAQPYADGGQVLGYRLVR